MRTGADGVEADYAALGMKGRHTVVLPIAMILQ